MGSVPVSSLSAPHIRRVLQAQKRQEYRERVALERAICSRADSGSEESRKSPVRGVGSTGSESSQNVGNDASAKKGVSFVEPSKMLVGNHHQVGGRHNLVRNGSWGFTDTFKQFYTAAYPLGKLRSKSFTDAKVEERPGNPWSTKTGTM